MIGQHVDLFAGVSMTSIPLRALGFETIAWAENDPFCQSVLEARHPNAVPFEDVCQLTALGLDRALPQGRSGPLLVSGGFPCPTISSAGYGGGVAASLWPEFARIIEDLRPEYVVVENVALLRRRGLPQVLWDLHSMGYNARWDCIPAGAVGAPHLRDRMFIVACPNYGGDPAWWPVATGYAHANQQLFCNAAGGIATGATITDLPRAGELRGKFIRGVTPAAPIKAVNAQLRSPYTNGVPLLPSTALSAWRRSRFYPTPTRQDGVGGPGDAGREGGKNLRTVIAEEFGNSRIHPHFTEWMMGVPYGWTDPLKSNDQLPRLTSVNWDKGPGNVTADHRMPLRRERVRACGNGLVPQALAYALRMLSELSPAAVEGRHP